MKRVPRIPTLAELRAEIDQRKAAAQPIADAWRRGDIKGVTKAQADMRKQFTSMGRRS